MRNGCLFGCMGLIAVTLLVALLVALGLDVFFGAFRTADRVDLADAYGQDHALMVRVDPSFELVFGTTEEAMGVPKWFTQYALPHEAIMFVDVDRERAMNDLVIALSSKRFAAFFSWYIPTDDWKLFRDAGVRDFAVQDNGVIYLQAEAPIPVDALERLADHGERTTKVPITLETGHPIEIIWNNNRGDAFLAMETFFSVAENTEEGNDAPRDALLHWEEHNLLAQAVSTGRIAIDPADGDAITMTVLARCFDEDVARESQEALAKLLQRLGERISADGAEMDGQLQVDGADVRGEYTITFERRNAVNTWQDHLENIHDRARDAHSN